MGVQSTIITALSDADRAELDKLIVAPGWTLDKLIAWLEERGYDITRSSLHRYGQNIKNAGEALRKTREMTQALVQDLGPKAVEGDTGRVLVEFFQSIVMDFMVGQVDGQGNKKPLKPMDMMLLAKGLNESIKALNSSADYAERIEKRVRTEAASAAEKVATQAGLTKNTVNAIKAAVLGIDVKGET